MRKHRWFFRIVFLLLFVLLLFVAFNFIMDCKDIKKHKDFFGKPDDEHKVEAWMDIMFIEKHFDVDVSESLNVSLNLYDKRMKLEDYCEKNSLDCDEIVNELNKDAKAIDRDK